MNIIYGHIYLGYIFEVCISILEEKGDHSARLYFVRLQKILKNIQSQSISKYERHMEVFSKFIYFLSIKNLQNYLRL